MADVLYWDIINGNDANDGLDITTPKRTLAGVYAIAANGDRIIVAPGVYPTSVLGGTLGFSISKTIMLTPQKSGIAIFDFEGSLPTTQHLALTVSCIIRGIHFRNMGVGKYALGRTGGTPVIIDCVFYQRDGAANTGRGVNGIASATKVENCSFYNLEIGCTSVEGYNNYFKTVTTPFSGTNTKDYNAFPGNTETNGINTSTGIDPGFRDAAAEDFRLDLDATGYAEEYMLEGQFTGSIGAPGAPGPWWDARFPQSRWMTPDPVTDDGMPGVWTNDAAYEDPAGAAFTGEIVEDTGDFEPIIDLASTPAALSGRLLSPVLDWGTSGTVLEYFPFARFEDLPAGAAIDTDDALPQKAEYRQSSTAFLYDDPESTDLQWVEFEMHEKIDLSERYQQFRITFQVNHTNA